MIYLKYGMFVLFLLLAAWEDARLKSVSIWIFILGAVGGVIWLLLSGQNLLLYAAGSLMGGGILILSKLLDGAVGEGDAAFFAVSGLFLGLWKNAELLLFGLLFSGVAGGGLLLWRSLNGKEGCNIKMPLIPFLVLPGIWKILS